MSEHIKDEPYRCNETIDLEGFIDMHNEEDAQNARIVVTYNSGRQERFECKLNNDKTIPKPMQKKISNFRSFPTVKKVEVVKF